MGGWGVPATADSVPLTVIGGYLGAGKTTLVNALLRDPGGRRLGVVVNDFGSLAIDATLLADAADGLVSLPNGCVCCTLGSDLQVALGALMDAAEPPEQIVVEVSGVADPAATAAWGTVPPFAPGGVIVLADAGDIRTKARDRYVGGEVRRQVERADLVIVTKSDVTSPGDLAATDEWLDDVAPDVPRLRAVNGDVSADVVLGLRPADVASLGEGGSVHGDRYERWSWTSDEPVARDAVDRFLAALPASVLRAKGVLVTGQDEAVAVDVVGARSGVRPAPSVPTRSELVAIGVRDTLDPDALDDIAGDAFG